MKLAVILYGPPGSGKGTQANLLAEKFGLYHLDTGKYIEQVVHDPANRANKIIERERRLFDTGFLCTPSWVRRVVEKKTREVARAGLGIIYSGSPRTLPEAEALIPLLLKLYGKKRVLPFELKVRPETSHFRNGNRWVCYLCGRPLMYSPKVKYPHCPVCGSALHRRTLDDPEVIKKRLVEYCERTIPIYGFLARRGYKLIAIDGEPLPFKVFSNLQSAITRRLQAIA
ncbi:MAG: nucleoside monophosphate kinase [bacterium]|nr:nucleoside monophosphate kinase [bacterium]